MSASLDKIIISSLEKVDTKIEALDDKVNDLALSTEAIKCDVKNTNKYIEDDKEEKKDATKVHAVKFDKIDKAIIFINRKLWYLIGALAVASAIGLYILERSFK